MYKTDCLLFKDAGISKTTNDCLLFYITACLLKQQIRNEQKGTGA